MNIITRLVTVIAILLALVLTVPISPVHADCVGDGTDTVVCESGTTDTDGTVTSGGTDTTTVETEAAIDIDVDSSTNIGIDGNGGDNTVLNEGIVSVCGEQSENSAVGNSGSNDVTNDGIITACGASGSNNYGVGATTGDNEVINNGDITITGGNGDNFAVYNENGDNTVTNNDTITVTADHSFNYAVSNQTGDNTLNNNGTINVTGDYSVNYLVFNNENYTSGVADNFVTNNGEIAVTGYGATNYGVANALGDNTIINNGSFSIFTSIGEGIGINNVQGDNFFTNNGDFSVIGGDGYEFTQGGVYSNDGANIVTNNGSILISGGNGSQNFGIYSFVGNDVIVNNGSLVVEGGTYSLGISTGNYGDIVTLGAGSLTSASNVAVNTGIGNDTVNIFGNQTVTYRNTCGNISMGTFTTKFATVIGDVDGGGDNDTLNFFFNGYDSGLTDGFVNSVENYNFESINHNFTISSLPDLGPTTLHDDGVVMGYAANDGIVVCSGEGGVQAGTVSFSALDSGQTGFDAGNGWYVTVTSLGGGQYQAHLFDSAGLEHFNDSNHDGLNDSPFSFSR